MPIYEYRCTSCGEAVEVIQKLSDKPLGKCPRCSGKLEKLISRTSFHLKGGGWFGEDYSRKSAPPDKADKADKADKTDKTDKADKTDKTDKASKKGSASADSSSDGKASGGKSSDSSGD